MKIGLLREIKDEEYRVALTPPGVEVLAGRGHAIWVETGAGAAVGFADDAYTKAGAKIVEDPNEIFGSADMVLHVKEVQSSEYGLLRPGLIVFAYLHLAADLPQTQAFMAAGSVAIAYETIQNADGQLPLLQPMSEVAGRMAVQEGAKYLEMPQGGRGILLGGVPGLEPARVVIIGGGVVGTHAARMACGLGAEVVLLDASLERLRRLSEFMPANCKLLLSNPTVLRDHLGAADLVIGAVLLPGARAPRVVTRSDLARMKPGAVLVDVAIDQGGCFETSRPTTHRAPTFIVDGIIHYCVTNMPGAVARTSTLALTNATLPYILALADKGWKRALADDAALRRGLNVCRGQVVCQPVADALGLPCAPLPT